MISKHKFGFSDSKLRKEIGLGKFLYLLVFLNIWSNYAIPPHFSSYLKTKFIDESFSAIKLGNFWTLREIPLKLIVWEKLISLDFFINQKILGVLIEKRERLKFSQQIAKEILKINSVWDDQILETRKKYFQRQ